MDKKLIKERNKAYDEHYDKFNCPHVTKELRKQIIADGSTRYVYQCIFCGHSQGQPIKKDKAFELSGDCEPPDFDLSIKDNWDYRKKCDHDKIEQDYLRKRQNKDTEFWKGYDAYLKTEEWKEIRKKVLFRAQDICEGCRENHAIHVHHLSYEHVGNEFLFELVAVCKDCHDRIHEKDEIDEEEN